METEVFEGYRDVKIQLTFKWYRKKNYVYKHKEKINDKANEAKH